HRSRALAPKNHVGEPGCTTSHTALKRIIRLHQRYQSFVWLYAGLPSLILNDKMNPAKAAIPATIKETFTPCMATASVSSGRAAVLMMVTSTAVPTDPATCRNVLFMAVPCGIR